MLGQFHNQFDPNNPEDALIIGQRKIRNDWERKFAAHAPTNLDISSWVINPVSIYEEYGISRQDLVIAADDQSLVQSIQRHLLEVYNRRSLIFSPQHAFAIADPDETDQSEERLVYQGVLVFAAIAYDLRVPVVLNRELDVEQFDFFFALKLLKVPQMRMDDFLDFQMKTNFNGNSVLFTRFLRKLLRYVYEELSTLTHADILWYVPTDGWKTSLEEWLDMTGVESRHQTNTKPDLKLASEDRASLPETKKPIQDDINAARFRRALNGLKAIKNKDNLPIISDDDLLYLKEQGPYINLGDTHQKIKLALTRNDKSKVYNFFHWLWDKFAEAKNRGITGYAEYLACYFQDFTGLQLRSLSKSFEPPGLSLKKEFDEAYNNSKD